MPINLEDVDRWLEAVKVERHHIRISGIFPTENAKRVGDEMAKARETDLLYLREALIRANKAELDLCELREKLDDYRVAVDRLQTRILGADRLFSAFTPHPDNVEADPPLLTKIVDALVALPDETSPATYRERMQDYALTTLAVLKREGVIR